MIGLFHTAKELQNVFIEKGWKFCFIGGLALQRWGEMRLTRDVDVTLFTGFGLEEPAIDELLSRYNPRVENAKQFALENRVLLLESKDKIGMDVALGGIPFEEEMIRRATQFEFLPDLSLLTCSAEDLIVLKAFADRPQDWTDIKGIIVRQEGKILWDYVRKQLEPLCLAKESPGIMNHLDKVCHDANS
ncbi:MAG: nucleotidyl transferase AbiEii/AbiGii toxin family protein [Elusimicrobiales bacterium]|nr:nucleotidyl transferase AbiEii/AbiGii toxin family protein [Elusimicrobiales bacterium]